LGRGNWDCDCGDCVLIFCENKGLKNGQFNDEMYGFKLSERNGGHDGSVRGVAPRQGAH
jgi:hypothetical protein